MDIKIMAWTDSPLVTTGFANASRPFLRGFHDAGAKLSVLGRLGEMPDVDNEYPYTIYPVSPMDHLGRRAIEPVLLRERPDVLWIMDSPGNLAASLSDALATRASAKMDFAVVAYNAVEGDPMDEYNGHAYDMVKETGGLNVFWTKYGQKLALDTFDINGEQVYFGMDNEDLYPYSDDDRALLRRTADLEDVFLIGTVGVNKRTKGLVETLKVAKSLKDKNIVFYIHTDPVRTTMNGYNLKWLQNLFGCENVIFPPDDNVRDRNGYWSGTTRSRNSADRLRELQYPACGPYAWGNYSFLDRMNCFDLYLDLSRVDGWNLPVAEAMSCGVPVLGVKDFGARDELFSGARIDIEPLPKRMWDTWHTSADLVTFDPDVVARKIVEVRESVKTRESAIKSGLNRVSQFKWRDSILKMNNIVKGVAERRTK